MSETKNVTTANSQSSVTRDSPNTQNETVPRAPLREPQPVPPKFITFEKSLDVLTQNQPTFGASNEKK